MLGAGNIKQRRSELAQTDDLTQRLEESESLESILEPVRPEMNLASSAPIPVAANGSKVGRS
jgi:hypothetical protein